MPTMKVIADAEREEEGPDRGAGRDLPVVRLGVEEAGDQELPAVAAQAGDHRLVRRGGPEGAAAGDRGRYWKL